MYEIKTRITNVMGRIQGPSHILKNVVAFAIIVKYYLSFVTKFLYFVVKPLSEYTRSLK